MQVKLRDNLASLDYYPDNQRIQRAEGVIVRILLVL